MTRRRLAVLLAGIVGATGLGVLPAAHADEPASTSVPVRQWGCVWVDLLQRGICLGR